MALHILVAVAVAVVRALLFVAVVAVLAVRRQVLAITILQALLVVE